MLQVEIDSVIKMSASAVKPSMQGASMQPSPPPTHAIIPMNMMAQKVVPSANSGSETSPAKPLPGTTLSYTTLQPPSSQPLSLVQEHKPPPQTTSPPCLSEKKIEIEKNIPNGVEAAKPISTEEGDSAKKLNEANQQNNNLNTENLTQPQPQACLTPVPEAAVVTAEVTGIKNTFYLRSFVFFLNICF